MAQRRFPTAQPDPQSGSSNHGDPWLTFGHLVSGVLLYGAIGWGLDHWWGTSFMVVIGILAGATMGIYLTWARFRETTPAEVPQDETT